MQSALPLISCYGSFNSLQRSVLIDCLQQAILHLNLLHQRESALEQATVTYDGKSYTCVDYDITQKMVSIHIPLTRLTAALLVLCPSMGITWEEAGVTADILRLSENVLQTVCLCAQTNAGAWRRNGMALANQVYYCKDYRCRTEAFNRDLQFLQTCAAVCDPDQFFVTLYYRMHLHSSTGLKEVTCTTLILVYLLVVCSVRERCFSP